MKKYFAELLQTMVLVLFGCGVYIITDANILATALAFGLAMLVMYYMFEDISGSHLNPAVSLGMVVARKMSLKDFGLYCLCQIGGAILACVVLGIFFGFDTSFGANIIRSNSDLDPTILDMFTWDNGTYFVAFLVEMVMTWVFVGIFICMATKSKNKKIAGIVIGLALVLVYLFALRLTNGSFNPARSIAPAIFRAFNGDMEPLKQIWIFILAPLAGGILAAITHNVFESKTEQ